MADLLHGELTRQRRVGELPPRPWQEDLALESDLGVDSLERMTLAAALAESLQLHESGIEDYLLASGTLRGWVDVAEAGLSRFSARLVFRTSGSSGLPKACVHPLALLLQETSHLAHMFEGHQRLLIAVPAHHVYGFLFTVLLPRALGLRPEAVIALGRSSPAWLASAARAGDLVIGHPEFWQTVARTVPRLPAGVTGVTSTAPCPDPVSDALESAGIARLVHVYGASETGGIGWRTAPRTAYRLFPYWTFSPANESEVVRTLPDGTRQAYVCQDRIGRLSETDFDVGARHDGGVQVAGVNVFPSLVAAVLRQHPLVADVAVRLMRPEEGSRLKAFVVPKQPHADSSAFMADLRGWIDSRLTAPERPKAIRTGTRLPATAAGKLSDWSIEAGSQTGF